MYQLYISTNIILYELVIRLFVVHLKCKKKQTLTIQNGIVRCDEVLKAAQLAHMSQHRFAGEVMKKRI